MAYDETSTPRRHPEATSRNVDGEEVIMLPNVGQVHVLNETGAFLWARLDGQQTVKELARSLAEEFDTDPETARKDTLALLEELTRKEAVLPGTGR